MAAPTEDASKGGSEELSGPRVEVPPRVGNRTPPLALTRLLIIGTIIAMLVTAMSPLVAPSASASKTTTTVATAKGTVGPLHSIKLLGRWVSRGVLLNTTGHVDISIKWDAFNNCAERDGTEFKNLEVKAGQYVTLGYTTVASGQCGLPYELSKMHWQVTALDSSGKPTTATADVSLNQQGFPRLLDYLSNCEGMTGSMHCATSGILGTNVQLNW